MDCPESHEAVSNGEVTTLTDGRAMPEMVAFVRGMAIYKHRRILKAEQEDLLQRHLPNDIQFFGAFDDSGNYALGSNRSGPSIRAPVATALRRDQRLRDLEDSEVTIVSAGLLREALAALVKEVSEKYRSAFNRYNFEVRLGGGVWRAGLAFLTVPRSLMESSWPSGKRTKVIVLESSGTIGRFLKREEQGGENRITFGDPTRAVEAAIRALAGDDVGSTSRSARTVRGVLSKYSARRQA